jgi:hypothetical protein
MLSRCAFHLDNYSNEHSSISSPEVEVTELIVTKVQDFCQLASHKRGSFSDLRFSSTIPSSLWTFHTPESGADRVSYLSTFANVCFFNKIFYRVMNWIQNKQKT